MFSFFNILFYKFFLFFLLSKIYCFDPKNYNLKLETISGKYSILIRNKISLYLKCTLKDCNGNTIEINNNLKKGIIKYLKVDNEYDNSKKGYVKVDNKVIKSAELLSFEENIYIKLGNYRIYVKNDSILKNSIKICEEESKYFLYSDEEFNFILTDDINFYLEDKKYSDLDTELQNNYKGIINTITNYYKSNYSNNTVIDEILNIDKIKNYVKKVEYFINDEKRISLKVDFKDPFNYSKIVFKDSDDKEITNEHIIDNYINNVILKNIKSELKNLTKFEDKLNYIKDFSSSNSNFKIDLKLEDNSKVFYVKKNKGVDEIALYLDYLIKDKKKAYINFIKDLYNNEKDEKPQKKWGFYDRLFKSYYTYVNNEKYLDECIKIIKSLGGYYPKFKDIYDRIFALKNILNEKLKNDVSKLNEDLKKIFDVKKNYMTYGVIDYFSSNFADTIKYRKYRDIDYISSNGNDLTFKIISCNGKYELSVYKISVLKEIEKIDILDNLKKEIIKKNEDYVKSLIALSLDSVESDIFKKYKDKDLNELNGKVFEENFTKDFEENIKKVNIEIVKSIKDKLLKIAPYKAKFEKLVNGADKEKYTTSIYERYKKLLSNDFLNKNFQYDAIEQYLELEYKCKMLLSLFKNQYLKKIENYEFNEICQYMLNTSYELKYDNFKKIFEDDFIKFVNKFSYKEDISEKIKESIDFSDLNNKLKDRFDILIKDIIKQFTDNEIVAISKFTKLSEVDNYKNKEKEQFKINLVNYISTKSNYFKQNYDKFNKDSTNLLFNNDIEFVDTYFNEINIKLNEKRTEFENNVKIDNEEANKLYQDMIKVVNDIKNDLDTKITKLTKSNLESYNFKTEDEIKNYINEEFKKIADFETKYKNYSKIKTSEGQEISSLIDSKISSVFSLLKQNYDLKVNKISIVKINYTLLNEDQFNENVKTQYNSFIKNDENKKFDSRKKYKDLYKFIRSKFNFIEDVLKDNQSIKDSEDVINVDNISLILILKEQYKKPKDDTEDDEHKKDEHNDDDEEDPNKKEKKDQSENNDPEVSSDIIDESDNKKGCCKKCSGGNKTKSESKTKSSKKCCSGK